MTHLAGLLLATVLLRPYVFIFLTAYLLISTVSFGLRATLMFTLLTYLAALACEWSSIHNGFPFGLYHYIETTRDLELWVAGVPFMDSLSFTFLAFASYSVALLVNCPLYRRGIDLRVLDTKRLRRARRVWLLAALFMVMIDLAVDPLSARGERWFLGRLFWYDPPGPHFGVPISNYVGWFVVAAVAVGIFQTLDARFGSARKPWGVRPAMPSRALLGPALYVGIVVFALVMLFRIGSYEIAWSSLFIFLPFLALVVNIVIRPENYGDARAIARHLEDFPYNRAFVVDSAARALSERHSGPALERRVGHQADLSV